MRVRLLALVSPVLLFACVSPVGAWPPGGVQFERAEPVGSNGALGLGRDGAGGTYTAWVERDTTGAYAFRVHRLNVQGDPPSGWTAAGVRTLAPATPFAYGLPLQLVPDGDGGTYIAWTESDSTAHVGHLASDGSLVSGWPARGLSVSSFGRLSGLVATEDGTGGVLLVFVRRPNLSPPEIVVQRFLTNGARASGFTVNGRQLTSPDNQQGRYRPSLVRDADRGFWISFHTVTADASLAPSAYAVLHLEPTGLPTAGQPTNGLQLSVPDEIGRPESPVPLALDGDGGAFAFTLGTNGNVRAFHVLSSGLEDPSWPEGGVQVASGAGWPSDYFTDFDEDNWPVATGDLSGGAWAGWCDATDFLLHVTHVEGDGTISPGWTSPLPIAGAQNVTLIGDAAGLYAASLEPVSCIHLDCYGPFTLGRVSLDGALAPGWPDANPPAKPAPGIVVGSGRATDGPRLVADGAGGVVVGWSQNHEYYAMRFTIAGQLAGVSREGAGGVSVRARFDRAAGVRVWYSTGAAPRARIELFDVRGRRVASVSVAAGSGEITLAGSRTLGAGVFMARITCEAGTAVTKLVAFR